IPGPGSPSGSHFTRLFETSLHEITRKDLHSEEIKQAREEQPNRALADDEYVVTAEQGQPFNRFKDRVNRLEHGPFNEGIFCRNGNDARKDKWKHFDVLGVSATSRFKARSDAGALVLGTLRKG